MQTVHMEGLPEELQSRILAATAHASHRGIRCRDPHSDSGPSYTVEAVSGDRVTLMRLWLRPDGSVDERTDSFTARDIVQVDRAASELTVQGPGGTRSVTVAPDTAEAIRGLKP